MTLPFWSIKNIYSCWSQIYWRENDFCLHSETCVPFKIPSYILQWPGLPAGLAATDVPGEQLVQPSHNHEMSGADKNGDTHYLTWMLGQMAGAIHFPFDRDVDPFKDPKAKT